MASALLTSVFLGIVCLALSIYYGYVVPGSGAFGRHLTLALASTFLLSLGHSMTMFFFIGTGKHIKQLVREHAFGPEIVRETIVYKNKLFPPMMLAIILTMAEFIIGGGVHTRLIPAWIHHLLAWAALGSNIHCFWLEGKYLVSNSRLMNSVYRTLDR